MIKLCVGISSVEELEDFRASRCVRVEGLDGAFHVHRTRMRPRRSGEIVGQGSLFWVIRGSIRCRQKIVALLPAHDEEGKSCCDIVMEPDLIRTIPHPKRPFQGWRYLPAKEAPGDLGASGDRENDAQIAGELAALGLI